MKALAALLIGVLFLVCVDSFNALGIGKTRKIRNKHYKFSMLIPGQMIEVRDSCSSRSVQLYYDSSSNIVLMVSARESKFKSVDDYLSCTTEQLEQNLRSNYGDSTLKLISCSRSLYYPYKITVLNFEVSGVPFGYNTHLMYFIHHRHRDVQLSFAYKRGKEKQSINYIYSIMKTLKLKRIL